MKSLVVVLSCLVAAAASASYYPVVPLGYGYAAAAPAAPAPRAVSGLGAGDNTVIPQWNILPRGLSVEIDAKLSLTRNADGSASGVLTYVDQNGISRKDGYVIDANDIRFDDSTVASYAQIPRALQ